jgi:alkylglycerol monooxygenase
MYFNIVALAIPLFLGFMALEYWVSCRQGRRVYDFADFISNLNVGIAERLSDVFVTGIFYFVYDYLHRHFALWQFEPNPWHFVLLLVFTDFLWYWYHRLGHEVNILWGLHVVHHQSPEFNYSASVRVTVFQAFARTAFWAFLPIIGFPADMIMSVLLLHGLYPFFVHTQVVGKLGWLEYILVTPSHHRVHHASNPEYLDKNYGDILIIWDKIFGTFKEEKDRPVYGLTKPLNSYSFLWQHFHFLLEIGYAIRQAPTWGAKMRLLFGKPDLIAPEGREVLERYFRISQRRRRHAVRHSRYILWQISAVLLWLFLFVAFEHYTDVVFRWLSAAVILITVINCGAILEQRRWIFRLELLRAAVLAIALWWYQPGLFSGLSLGAALFLSAWYYSRLQRRYLKLVYRRV